MGKPVEAYHMSLENEKCRWRGVADALRRDDKEAFDALMDACRKYASAGSNATQPLLFELMVMSILLSLQKKNIQFEKEVDAVKRQP